MSVIPLTILFSLLLAGLFIGLFAHEQRRRRFASPERDSLLPLADEIPHVVAPGRAPGDEVRDGARPPGPGGVRHDAAPGQDPYPESIYF